MLHSPVIEARQEEDDSSASPRSHHRSSLDSTAAPEHDPKAATRMYAGDRRSEELDRPLMLPSPTLQPSKRGTSGPRSRMHLPVPADSSELESQLASQMDPTLLGQSSAAAAGARGGAGAASASASQDKDPSTGDATAAGRSSASVDKDPVSVAFPDPWVVIEAAKRRES